jgi:hypothetical protein
MRQQLSPMDRAALAAIAGQFFVNGAMTASFVARAPQIRDRIGVTIGEFGILLTIAATAGIAGSLAAGRVVHSATTRRVLRFGGVAMVLSLLAIGSARSPTVWLVGMLVYLFFDVLVDISMNLQGSWISARRHTPIMNRLHGLWSLGTLAGGVGAVAANALEVSPAIHLAIVGAFMALLLAIVTGRVLTDDAEGQGNVARPSPLPDQTRLSRLVPVALLVLAGMFAVVSEVTGGEWAAFRMTDDLQSTGAVASLAFVAYTFGMTSMRFGGDWLQLRLGSMGLFRLSAATATGGFILATLVADTGPAIVGFLLVGVGVATFMPKLYDDGARLPGRRGAGLGAMTAGMRIAFLLTPFAVGAIAESSRSVGEAIAIVTLPAMVGLVVVTEWNDRLLRLGTSGERVSP